ncbi:MAG: hypothetical protein O2982_07740, partial [Actinomycetota bacterium]|nr:hypothetical protein [Actinomycetota bacterium]
RIRRQYDDHRIARFFEWPIDDTGGPTRVYWLEGVTRADVENALYGYTDRRWGWLCRPAVRRALAIANPVSWALTLYGATDLPLNLGFADSADPLVSISTDRLVRHLRREFGYVEISGRG